MGQTRGEQAAERARLAMARAEQLTRRLAELRDRRPSSPASVHDAARSAQEAIDQAAYALHQSAEAHHRAAELHRRMADLLDHLDQPDRAAEHRRLGDLDEQEALADERAQGTGGAEHD